ncbi:SpoU_methylase-domain-containing protein [Fragilariopsis cylindrus CCMP1102]|uniref:SpoU_methylase-domain-containing protein n=1 Tax=Fragilariopsis cylindrus CCMP1102 TaxID=635003 RepID=A0A1E7EPN0_9STRA|nr:SpoU_methylase-domain-containing protein [Fragilariopsis cylindrus CCMP1102]|eukprot:OEU07493.1 SpoU_methylase-domain-containing protein [Fragilariopsis cylindrus CCMP1102]
MKLDPILVSKATSILEPWINEKRQQRITTVLKHRTRNVKFLYENPANPSNVWACLRTIDSFGIQNVDLIIDSGMYGEGKQTLMQKRGMRTAMGSAQWLTLTNYPSTKEAIQHIREVQGYKIYASDLNPNSIDIHQNQDQRPICIVMGNEDRGISDEMRLLADETFTLPMYGFAESFNLSVATSIILAHMSSKSVESSTGPLRPGDLNEHEYNCLYLKGLLKSLPKKRLGIALLKKNDIILPADLI